MIDFCSLTTTDIYYTEILVIYNNSNIKTLDYISKKSLFISDIRESTTQFFSVKIHLLPNYDNFSRILNIYLSCISILFIYLEPSPDMAVLFPDQTSPTPAHILICELLNS